MHYIKTNYKFDIQKLRDWFQEVKTNHSDREFEPIKYINELEEKYRENILANSIQFNHVGYCITSNVSDEYPQSFFPTKTPVRGSVGEHRTPLAFGYITELLDTFPNCISWVVSCQRPLAEIEWHVDDVNEMALWIPLYVDESLPCFAFKDGDDETDYYLQADGSVYLIDNRKRHRTYNKTKQERVMIICRFNVNTIEGQELVESLKQVR